MAKQKGALKTGGRQKGTPNRRTLVLQSVTEAMGMDVPRRLAELLPQLEPGKQADVLLDLMGYLYPKRKSIEHSGPDGNPIQVEATRADLRKLIANPEALSALETVEEALQKVPHGE